MNKKTALENLLFNSGLQISEFAEKINVKKSTFENQLYKQKHRHIEYAFKYGQILGVHFELVVK